MDPNPYLCLKFESPGTRAQVLANHKGVHVWVGGRVWFVDVGRKGGRGGRGTGDGKGKGRGMREGGVGH